MCNYLLFQTVLQASGENALTDFIESYYLFFEKQRSYFQNILSKGVYIERDGTTKDDGAPNEKHVPINAQLEIYLNERIQFWAKKSQDLRIYVNSLGEDRSFHVYEEVAKRTLIATTAYCPKIFFTVCDKLRRENFTNPENVHAINVFEVQCKEWAHTYLFAGTTTSSTHQQQHISNNTSAPHQQQHHHQLNIQHISTLSSTQIHQQLQQHNSKQHNSKHTMIIAN